MLLNNTILKENSLLQKFQKKIFRFVLKIEQQKQRKQRRKTSQKQRNEHFDYIDT